MSMDATAWAFRQRGLTHREKLCLVLLADCHDPVNGGYVGLPYLCEELEVSTTECVTVVNALVSEGMISLKAGDGVPFPHGPLLFDMPIED